MMQSERARAEISAVTFEAHASRDAKCFHWVLHAMMLTSAHAQGECTVTPDNGDEPVQIKAGDMAVFPKVIFL